MEAVINITAPIFFLILLGYLGGRLGFIPKELLPGLSRFVLYFALPALVFTKIVSMDVGQLIHPQYMMLYAAGGMFAFVFTVLISRFAFREPWAISGVHGLGGSMSNSAFVGFPILLQVFDHPMMHAFAMVIMVENVILFPAGLIFIEAVLGKRSANGKPLAFSVAKRIVTNPIIVAVFTGVAFASLGITLPAFIAQGLDVLAMGSAPAALIVIGGSLVGLSIKGRIGPLSLVALSKLIVFPLVVASLLRLTPTMPNDLNIAIMIFACVPMFSIYPIVGGQYGEQNVCASSLLVTTVLSFFTLTALLHFLV
ncbi:AEC family transporter [Marinomonas sp. IMCC 4694]|uniref:AEC family transporter n=1 Tax=Marinomonas sp. IMCC 4694 TaxID=2605432 RepID=UPI0011E77F0A|nr:AEC family transporter [Marinomonas sp. IMCC 4694]TYL48844.1 AEC family transporter [Marinomonas sp. IMCC 4694]